MTEASVCNSDAREKSCSNCPLPFRHVSCKDPLKHDPETESDILKQRNDRPAHLFCHSPADGDFLPVFQHHTVSLNLHHMT